MKPTIEESRFVWDEEDLDIILADTKSTKARPTHDPLAALAFDAKDTKWRNELIDRTLPLMAVAMLEAMTAEMMEMGINPKNLTKGKNDDNASR